MGVSFVSVFILTYHVFFWVCGLAHSLSWDYAPGVPQGEAANIRVSWREKPIGGFIWRQMLKVAGRESEGRGPKSVDSQSHPHVQTELGVRHPPQALDEEATIEVVRRTPRCSVSSSPHQGFSDQSHRACESQATLPASTPTRLEVPSPPRRVFAAIAVVVTPISVIVATSLFIALLDPLKALFIQFEGGPLWEGPDGKPPLAFVIDTGFLSPHLPLRSFLTARESQAYRWGERTHDLVPSGRIIRPNGHQAGPWIRPSRLRPPIGLCHEDGLLAYYRSFCYSGHDNWWSDTSRVEGSNLCRYLRERHTICT